MWLIKLNYYRIVIFVVVYLYISLLRKFLAPLQKKITNLSFVDFSYIFFDNKNKSEKILLSDKCNFGDVDKAIFIH